MARRASESAGAARRRWEARAREALPERRENPRLPLLVDAPEDPEGQLVDRLGFPGSPPYTRGIQPTMYRGRLWTFRQYSGFGSAVETNRRFRYLLEGGQTGLSVAFDLPTQVGYDSDHPKAQGEVGRCGVAISSLGDMHALFDEPEVGEQGELGITVRYLTPHNKWSIHSEYQDNLFMLSLSRGGPTIWMSRQDAAKIGVRDNDWIEAVNRNGVVNARAIVSHRMPEGTVYMHHAQDRLIDVPRTETTKRRGGIHNSLTRLLIKPSHLIGGYAQLSYAFNYLGPTGNQRDEVTVIRRRGQEVEY